MMGYIDEGLKVVKLRKHLDYYRTLFYNRQL